MGDEQHVNTSLRNESSDSEESLSPTSPRPVVADAGNIWTSPVDSADSRSTIRASLQGRNLWEEFNKLGTEMIVTRRGRRMFPPLKLETRGLEPSKSYVLMMDMAPVDKYRYKFQNSVWVKCFEEECTATRPYIHPESPALGSHWMKMIITFYKLKLSNNPLDKNCNVIVNSMHRYQPRLHIVEATSTDPDQLENANTHTVIFTGTDFTTVTAYQNDQITQLKIDNNPFAKGFRSPFSRCRTRNSVTLYQVEQGGGNKNSAEDKVPKLIRKRYSESSDEYVTTPKRSCKLPSQILSPASIASSGSGSPRSPLVIGSEAAGSIQTARPVIQVPSTSSLANGHSLYTPVIPTVLPSTSVGSCAPAGVIHTQVLSCLQPHANGTTIIPTPSPVILQKPQQIVEAACHAKNNRSAPPTLPQVGLGAQLITCFQPKANGTTGTAATLVQQNTGQPLLLSTNGATSSNINSAVMNGITLLQPPPALVSSGIDQNPTASLKQTLVTPKQTSVESSKFISSHTVNGYHDKPMPKSKSPPPLLAVSELSEVDVPHHCERPRPTLAGASNGVSLCYLVQSDRLSGVKAVPVICNSQFVTSLPNMLQYPAATTGLGFQLITQAAASNNSQTTAIITSKPSQ